MRNQMNLPIIIENFFNNKVLDQKFLKTSLFLIRSDGVLLYSKEGLVNSNAKVSIGVLLAGVWQAAYALSQFIPTKLEESFRLSFDSSSQGIYLLPISYKGIDLFLGLIFQDEVNPAYLKNKLKDLANSLSEYLENNDTESVKIIKKETTPSNFLFDNISDSEMDSLFAFTNK